MFPGKDGEGFSNTFKIKSVYPTIFFFDIFAYFLCCCCCCCHRRFSFFAFLKFIRTDADGRKCGQQSGTRLRKFCIRIIEVYAWSYVSA